MRNLKYCIYPAFVLMAMVSVLGNARAAEPAQAQSDDHPTDPDPQPASLGVEYLSPSTYADSVVPNPTLLSRNFPDSEIETSLSIEETVENAAGHPDVKIFERAGSIRTLKNSDLFTPTENGVSEETAEAVITDARGIELESSEYLMDSAAPESSELILPAVSASASMDLETEPTLPQLQENSSSLSSSPSTTIRQAVLPQSLPPVSRSAADLFRPLKNSDPANPIAQTGDEASEAGETGQDGSTGTANATDAALRISPRVGVGYNGAGGAGFDSFGRIEGFVPLRQNPGGDITFLEGRFLLDNEANPGANVIFGHRAYSKKDKRIYGGYLAYDNRDTGSSTFNQLGLGFESLGEVWDIRTNFYIPVGQRSNRLAATGFTVENLLFREHFLILQGELESITDAAMTGFDLEAGGKIAKIGKRGDLRLYGGPYYYSAEGSPDTVGFRMRLEARPNRYLNLGVGFQTDGLFGTNLLFRVGATFPSARPKGPIDEEDIVLARMGESVERRHTIVVDRQENRKDDEEFPAINPSTGQPWFFNHVTLGGTNGDGTFENPFGTVQDGLNNTRSDGNDIVYVAFGTNPGIPPFSIPDKVQVLSRGPVQTLPVTTRIVPTSIETIQIPFSNSGNFPVIDGALATGNTVTMGNDSVLSGFTINPTTGNVGVLGSNVSNVEIRDNFINTSGESGTGIRLQNVSGFATITNNQIQTTGSSAATTTLTAPVDGPHAIELNLDNTTLTTATISGNTLNTQGRLAQTITIGALNNSTIGTLNIANNTATTVGAYATGLSIGANSSTVNSTTISGNTITTTGGDSDAIAIVPVNNSTISNTTISSNTLNTGNVSSDGVFIGSFGSTIGNTTISGNTFNLTGRDAQAISVDAFGSTATISDTTISGNTISNQGRERLAGILINTEFRGTISNTTISGNTITIDSVDSDGIDAIAGYGGTLNNLTISGNTINVIGGDNDGIALVARSGGTINSTTVSNNTITTQGRGSDAITASAVNGGLVATLTNNILTTQGAMSHGAFATIPPLVPMGSLAPSPPAPPTLLCLSLSGNTATTQQATSSPFHFSRPMAPNTQFQIVDTANTFPTTQANNTANSLGGAVAFFFNTGLPSAGFLPVAACP